MSVQIRLWHPGVRFVETAPEQSAFEGFANPRHAARKGEAAVSGSMGNPCFRRENQCVRPRKVVQKASDASI